MKFLSGLSRGAVVVTATTMLGSTFAITGAVLAGPARAAAVIDTSSQSAFIRSIAPLAQEGQRAYRVPASVAMAQAILESGWGRSALTTRGNAFFGIKCSRVMGPYATGCLNMRTREVFSGTPTVIVDGFRTYADPVDSFKDHGRFLTVNSRYRAAFNHTDDPKRFIAEVHRAGYATDPTYTAMIVRLMDQLDLYRFDTVPVASPSATESVDASPSASASATESVDASPSASASATESVGVSPSVSPSATESVDASPSVSPSATESVDASPSASVIVPSPTISVAVPVSTASTDWSAFGPPVLSASVSTYSQVPYAIPSTEVTPTVVRSPQTPSATPTGAVTTPHPTPTAPITPSVNPTVTPTASVNSSATPSPEAMATASLAMIPRLNATPTTSGTSSVTTAPAASRTPSATPSPSETMRTADVTAPAIEASAAVETGPQPMVGDGVAPDPSIEPRTESGSDAALTEPTDSPLPDRRVPSESAAPPIGASETFDPRGVRATQPQDPAKAGAQHPDGARVTVKGLRPQYERHGGLARTGR